LSGENHQMLRREDADRIKAEVIRRLADGVDALTPHLAELMHRSESWGPAEQQAYAQAVDAVLAEVTDWACRELALSCVANHDAKEPDV